MSLKKFVSGLLPFGKQQKKADISQQEYSVGAPVSPYEKYRLTDQDSLPKPSGRDIQTALVFVPSNNEADRKNIKPLKAKDVFLLEDINVKSADTIGLYFPQQSVMLIRDPNRGKVGRLIRWEQNAGHLPLFGDWSGSGNTTLGFFDQKHAFFYLWFKEDKKESDLRFFYGPPSHGWMPLVGDWNGDGIDGIGLYDPNTACFLLRNELSEGMPDHYFMYGPPGLGWIPLAGDWDGDGTDGIGVYDPLSGRFLLRNDLSGGGHDICFTIPGAEPDWVPMVGDWNGDGADSVGIYNPKDRIFYLCNQALENEKDLAFRFGPVGVPGIPFSVRWS